MVKAYKLKKKQLAKSKSKAIEISDDLSSTSSLLSFPCPPKKDIEMGEVDKVFPYVPICIPPICIGKKRSYS